MRCSRRDVLCTLAGAAVTAATSGRTFAMNADTSLPIIDTHQHLWDLRRFTLPWQAEAPDVTVEVLGFQWQWQFTYPDLGVTVTGNRDAQPELVLPSNSRVRFRLTSADVIHAFWIPGFRFKRDVIPGQEQEFDVEVLDLTGDFPNTGVCAEFCGVDHAYMRFDVRIVTPEEFQGWAAARAQEPLTEASA